MLWVFGEGGGGEAAGGAELGFCVRRVVVVRRRGVLRKEWGIIKSGLCVSNFLFMRACEFIRYLAGPVCPLGERKRGMSTESYYLNGDAFL